MPSTLRFLCLLPLTALLACGSNTIPGGTGSSAAVTGDYVLTAGVGTANATQISGGLYIQGSSVSGAFLYSSIQQSNCRSQSIPVTGSINNTYTTMTLVSSSFASGSVATITIPLPLTSNTNGGMQSTNAGTFSVVGGNCALASTPLQATYVPSISGTWTATFSNGSATAATASLDIQAPLTTINSSRQTVFAADASGQFPVTATLSFSGTGCSIPSVSLTGLLSGYTATLSDSTSTYYVSLNNTASPASISITGGCASGSVGTMTQK